MPSTRSNIDVPIGRLCIGCGTTAAGVHPEGWLVIQMHSRVPLGAGSERVRTIVGEEAYCPICALGRDPDRGVAAGFAETVGRLEPEELHELLGGIVEELEKRGRSRAQTIALITGATIRRTVEEELR